MRELIQRLRNLFLDLSGMEHFSESDFSPLSNLKTISEAERKAALILKNNPGVDKTQLLKDLEEGWVQTVAYK